ncbi:thrombospondin type 3 repeat-containing protein [Pseudomonadales bacterium]|nr:thrombospondin type 3 repeat-containing protein [Pseudomonadales bacterium]
MNLALGLRLILAILFFASFKISAATEFVPEDGAGADEFGYSVALKGDYALVGAPGDDDNFSNEGSIYVLEKLNGVWTQKEKIYASDSDTNGRFGTEIILSESGNSAIVDSKYYFRHLGDNNWSEISLINIGNIPGKIYGKEVVFQDDLIIYGSENSVKIYELTGDDWLLVQTFQSADIDSNDRFGESVAFDGQYLLVGAPGDYYTSGNAGSVYVFEYLDGAFTQTNKIWGDDRYAGRQFGKELIIFENHVVIGRNSGFELFQHPSLGWDLFEIPLTSLDDYDGCYSTSYDEDCLGFNTLRGPYVPLNNYDGYQSGRTVSANYVSDRKIEKIGDNLISFLSANRQSGRHCLTFSHIGQGELKVDGIHNVDGNYGSCNYATAAENGSMNDYYIDGANLIRGFKNKNIWGSSSGAVYFEDISPSLPEGEEQNNFSAITGDLTASVKQGGNTSGSISATDPDGLTDGSYFSIKTQPSNGTAFINDPSGLWFYVSNAPYEGPDPFVVIITDDQGNATDQTIDITVTGLTITGDTNIILDSNTPFNGDINAQDADGLDSLIYSLDVNPSNGAATVDAVSGNWSYDPNTDYIGNDSFTISISGVGFGQQVISLTIEYPDTDSDSIKDNIDNCISDSNTDQLDTDDDLLGDVCDIDDDNDSVEDNIDNCPISSNIEQSDLDQDGTGDACDPDKDGDGISNDIDNCLNDGNSNQNDLDNDSIGDVCDVDIDGDTVANTIEEKFGGDPSDPSDGEDILNDIEALNLSAFEVVIPTMGGMGLLALGLSMLGLGAVRLRKK